MIVIRPSEIYISTANVDMRKSIDGLTSIVMQRVKLDPVSDAICPLSLKQQVKR